jgi:putative ABC transport system permease protein
LFTSILLEALRGLKRNPIRSLLTMLGIVMGVASFICVVAIGNAGSSKVEEQLQNVGDNMIWVEAGSRSKGGVRIGTRGIKTLIPADAHAVIEQVPGVKAAAQNVDGRVQVIYGNENWGTTFRGVSPEYLEVRKWQLASGSAFGVAEVERAAAVCVLGKTVADQLFEEENPLGKIIRVKDMPCSVTGVLAGKGAAATGQDQDDFILLPISTAQKRITGTPWLDDIYFSTYTREQIPETTKEITALLRERHHLRPNEDEDFNIRSPEDAIRAQLAAANIVSILLASIASLSLLVGGIGIMNIMLVSVSQRTKEIGIRLAVGASERDVKFQFLAEAVALSAMGGLIGVFGGIGASSLLHRLLSWSMEITPMLLATSALFSTAIGVLFGYYPAQRAAQLDPIQALRFE